MADVSNRYRGYHTLLGLSTDEIGSSTSEFSSSIRTSYWASFAAFHLLGTIVSIILLIAVRVVPSSLRKTADILSIGLPASNLMLSLPLAITSLVKAAAGWYNIDNAGCIAEGVFHAFAFSTTFGTLALLALDARKKAETGVGMGARNAYLSLALVWAISAIGVGFSSIDSPSIESPSGLYCAYQLSSIQTYAFLVPVVIVAGLCITLVSLQVAFVILPKSENLDGSDVVYHQPTSNETPTVSVVAAAAAALNAANQVRMRKLVEARARIKVLWGLCLLFTCAWLPGIVGFGGVGSINGSHSNNLDAIGALILSLYSIVLPLLQIALSKNIRAAFLRVVLCKDFFLTMADRQTAIVAPNGVVDVKDVDIELGEKAKAIDPPPSSAGIQSTLQRSVGSDYPSNLTTHLSPLSVPRPISFAAGPAKHARKVVGLHYSNGDNSKLHNSFSQSGTASSFLQLPLSPLEPARRLMTGGSSVDVSTLQLSMAGGAGNDSLLPLPSDPSTPYNPSVHPTSVQRNHPPLITPIHPANAVTAPVTTTISISAHPPFNLNSSGQNASSSAAAPTTRTPVATTAANLLAIEAAAASSVVSPPSDGSFDPKVGAATGPLPKRRIRVHVQNHTSEIIAALQNLDESAIVSAREQRGARLKAHPQRPSSAIDPPASMETPRNPIASHSNSPLPAATGAGTGTGTPPIKHFAWKMMGSPHSVNRMSPSITPVGGRTPIETPRTLYSGGQSRNQSLASSAATSPALRPQQNQGKKRAPMTINQPPSFPITPRVPKDFDAPPS